VYTLESVILAQFEETFLESKEEIDEIIPRGTRIRINPYRKRRSKIKGFTIDKK
jgi:hypothetical protein